MKRPLLNVLLTELYAQLKLVEPHQDAEIDKAAYTNAMSMITYLIMWSENKADLRLILLRYEENKEKIPKENFID